MIFLIGFGSQGKAWAECLRLSGWKVEVFLSRQGKSFDRAQSLGFSPRLLEELPERLQAAASGSSHPALIPMMCPDSEIGGIYERYLANLELPFTMVLAHGFAVYSGDLKPRNPGHEIALLAPKAIGPKLEASFREAHAQGVSHRLVAGFRVPASRRTELLRLAGALGFSESRLAQATFEEETIGDLISEQGLLCGGVFTLLEWTMEAMARAGVPDALIREECLTELELIAGLLREKGPATTFRLISQAAQCGTIAMGRRFAASGVRSEFNQQVEEVLSKRFAREFRDGDWKTAAGQLADRLQIWEDRFIKKED